MNRSVFTVKTYLFSKTVSDKHHLSPLLDFFVILGPISKDLALLSFYQMPTVFARLLQRNCHHTTKNTAFH